MSESDHKYTFQGFDGPYWEKKAKREAALRKFIPEEPTYWGERARSDRTAKLTNELAERATPQPVDRDRQFPS